MRHKVMALAGAVVLLSTTAAYATDGTGSSDHPDRSDAVERVVLRDADGDRVGTVRMRQEDGFVRVSASVHSLTPGFHGFHVHETGICDPAAAEGPFTTAGGHYTTEDSEHGEHAGDLPSLLVTENGKAQLSFVTDGFTLDELRDDDGSAVMVHEGRDNYANIPERYSADGEPGPDQATLDTGDAGDRAACGAVDGDPAKQSVALRDADGDRVGTVRMRQEDGFVRVSASVHSLTPGFHGFHVHETGICDPAAAEGPFTTAGGHYTTEDSEHGEHAGDLPSLLVTENGKAQLSFVTDGFTLDELRDDDGSAVMVHEGRDNYANIPERYSADGEPGPDQATLDTGDAGDRAACGAVDAGLEVS